METSSSFSTPDASSELERAHVVHTQSSAIVPLLITAVVCSALFGVGGYYLGTQNRTAITTPVAVETPAPEVMSSPTATKKAAFADTLSKHCQDGKVAIDQLPFTLSQTLKTTYKIQTTIDCATPEESNAYISLTVSTPDFTGDDRNIYFYHEKSQWMGMGNNLKPLTEYHETTIDGQTFWLDIREPGPYGISTNGVWVDVVSEKKDIPTGTIVRAIDNEILKNQDLLDLVQKYGTKSTDESSPTYIITDPAKKALFIEEVVKISAKHAAFKALAKNVTTDLSGVTF